MSSGIDSTSIIEAWTLNRLSRIYGTHIFIKHMSEASEIDKLKVKMLPKLFSCASAI